MADPVYALIFTGLALALLVATLVPAPRHPFEDEAGLGLALLVTASAAALTMGVLAVLAMPLASAVLGAIAWLLVMPCIWLARAPRPHDEWGGEEPDDDDDDDGSPSPDMPSAPPAPDDRLPGLRPPVASAPAVTWTPAPPARPVVAMAARVRQLLAEQETERLHAAQEVARLRAEQEVQRILATGSPAEPPQPLADPPGAAPPSPAVSLHKPGQPRLRPAPRVRAEHGSIAQALAVVHARTRRRAAVDRARRRALR